MSNAAAGERAGQFALLAAVIIWAGWMPATRVAVEDGLSPVDVAVLRYGVPALVLLPVMLRAMPAVRAAPRWTLIAMMGWGAPFVLGVSYALQSASVAHLAAIVPVTMPLFALAVERLVFGATISRQQRIGFALIGLCAAIVLARVLSGGTTTSPGSLATLLACAAGWASFTVAFRRSGLGALQATAAVCAASTVLVLPLLALGSALGAVPARTIVFHATAQGLLSGLGATICFGMGIARLGATRAASFSVLVPLLATLMAFLWIGERPAVLDMVALCIGTAGVAIVQGVLRLPRR